MANILRQPEAVINVPVAILGAGPSGLAAAQPLVASGIDFALIDQGKQSELRDRNNPKDIVEGVGGSGLFSDGKFSFFPSATSLWRLTPVQTLSEAYNWFLTILTDHNVCLGERPFPDNECTNSIDISSQSEGAPVYKIYDSIKVSLSTRMVILETLWNPVASFALLGSRMVNISEPFSHPIELTLAYDNTDTSEHPSLITLRCNYLVLAGGRYSSLLFRHILPQNLLSFRRWEFGFRIEQPAPSFFLNTTDQIDPKLIWNSTINKLGYRTFCCCRDGEVVTTRSNGLLSVSGRSNGDPTGRSNIGFLLRSTDEALEQAFSEFLTLSSSLTQPVMSPSGTLFSGAEVDSNVAESLRATFGSKFSSLLLKGITALHNIYPILSSSNTRLYMPAIEGVGYYPAVESNLRISGTNIWVCGDASGIFRGLTAAFISGWFTGKIIANMVVNEDE